MKNERWETIEALFHAARDLQGEDRANFLDRECGADSTLRRKVELLLRGDEQTEGILNTTGPIAMETRVGPYEIVGWLGSGGMGEVYRARDTALKRDVAIKVLPDALAQDPSRIARFQREAEVLAKLNHPNIGAIYGLEEGDGRQALILELVEGPTLADRIAVGPVSAGEALPIARQIAEALEAAHDRGIIHRDLKPANIKITADGTVKVLDFGLAKVREGQAPVSSGTANSQQALAATTPGLIVGTVAYMSPEQARGKPVDKRTDIWAFGCILYEMLTGHAPFERDTITDTLAAIIERDPAWSALPATTPPMVQRLVFRCLDKELRSRMHDIADARIEIEEILSGAAQPSAGAAVLDRPRAPSGLPWSIAAAVLLVALIAIAALTWRVLTPEIATPQITRYAISPSGSAAVRVAAQRTVAVTSDGSPLYIGVNTIFLLSRDRIEPMPLVRGAAPLNYVFVSPPEPKGQWVGYFEGTQLRRSPLSGGPATTIIERFGAPLGATWSSDETIIMASDDPLTGLLLVSAEKSKVMSVLTTPKREQGEADHVWPEMLPGGQAVLFTIAALTGGDDAAQLAVLDLKTLVPKRLQVGGVHAHYVPSGHLVYTARGALQAIPFDLARLETTGPSVTVPEPVAMAARRAGDFDVGANGTLAYVRSPDATAEELALAEQHTLVLVDRNGQETPLAGAPAKPYAQPRFSPNGTQVAVLVNEPLRDVANNSEQADIWIWARGRLTRLTSTPKGEAAPIWLDEKNLAFFRPSESPKSTLLVQPIDGSRPVAVASGAPSGRTPDGKKLLFSPGNRDIMTLALDDTHKVEELLATPSTERNGDVSPDGQWLAYESDTSGAGSYEIYVSPYPNPGTGRWKISSDGGTRPRWSPAKGTSLGQELFYVASTGALMSVLVDSRGRAVGTATEIFKPLLYMTLGGRGLGVISHKTYDVSLSPEGLRFLMIKPAPGFRVPQPQINVVQDWGVDLKRIAPPKR